MRKVNRATLRAELSRAREKGWEQICLDAEQKESLPTALLLAIASRETDMNDVVGDHGHGRGLFQIDDRSHTSFLRKQGVLRAGRKPRVAEAAPYAAALVRWNLEYGRDRGVRERDQLKFALSAYNAGAGGALEGYRLGDSDRRTTGADYGRDVLARHAIFSELLDGGVAKPLKRGSRGRRVQELKRKLAAWYEKHAPGEFDRFQITDSPLFGAGVDRAVRDFQQRVGLTVDGIAGPKTIEALDKTGARGGGVRPLSAEQGRRALM